MTEFEYIEAASIAIEFVRSAAMDFVAVFFAYCVCAHFAGSSMPRRVAMGVSLIYTLFLLNPFAGLFGGMTNYLSLMSAGFENFPHSAFFREAPNTVVPRLLVLTAPILGWLASLAYMHFWIRRDSIAEQ